MNKFSKKKKKKNQPFVFRKKDGYIRKNMKNLLNQDDENESFFVIISPWK